MGTATTAGNAGFFASQIFSLAELRFFVVLLGLEICLDRDSSLRGDYNVKNELKFFKNLCLVKKY
jgi:hypothetical protein